MKGFDSILAQHGSDLVLALSCLLGVGALAMLLSRSPLHRQRVAELTLAAALLACGLLLLPLPRPGLDWLTVGDVAPSHAAKAESGPGSGPESGAGSGAVTSAAAPLSIPIADHALQSAPILRTTSVKSDHRSASVFPGAPGLLAQLFLLGAAGFAVHLLLSFALLRRTLRKATAAPAWVTRLASGSGQGLAPRVLLAQGVARPFCCGLGRGTIVLPAQLAQPALSARVEAVLAHERAHIYQSHPRARLLASLLAPFLYWHPLYWWLVRELRHCSELLADDMAAGRIDKRHYVTEFLELAESCGRVPAPQALGLGAFGTRKDFLIRMETLLMRRTRLSTRSSALHVTTRSLCAVLLLGSVSLAWGRSPQEGLPGTTDRLPIDGSYSLAGQNQKLPPHTYGVPAGDQPGIVTTVQFVDPRALGEFMVACCDADLTVELIDISPPTGASGRRTGRAVVRSPRGAALGQMLGFEIPGLSLVAVEHRKQQPVAAAPPRNPLAQRVDRMQQDLAELQDQIARLEALRADFRGREVDLSSPVDFSEPIDPAGRRLGTLGYLLDDSVSGLPTTREPLPTDLAIARAGTLGLLLDDAASGLPTTREPLPNLPVDRSPAGISGLVVSTLGGDQDLVAIQIATDQVVDIGQVFEVFKDSTYKGRVRITNVSTGLCIGVIELRVDGTQVQAGDNATTRLRTAGDR